VKVPLVCLPPVSGTADVFFKQILSLSAKGIRVMAVSGSYNNFLLTWLVVKLFIFIVYKHILIINKTPSLHPRGQY
jgi:hypothetical protein